MESKDIVASLKSGNPEVVIQSIEEVKETGTSSLFPVLMSLLHETSYQEIKRKIFSLFAELKSTDTVPLLMDAITNEEYKEERRELVSCCWQNGMNYSSFLPVFVDLVISEDFPTALEALTVIENMYGNIDQQIVNQQLEKIKHVKITTDEQKNFLLDSLPSAITSIKENREYS
jgi:hypothetical protein